MKFIRFAPTFLALLAALTICTSSLHAAEADLARVTSTVAQVFSEGHYTHAQMDAGMSQKCLNAYLEKLDPDHLFFTREDIDRLALGHSASFGKETKEGSLAGATAIFELYKKRVHERRGKIEEMLKAGHFDFESNRSVELTRENAQWPKDNPDADAVWRDQILGDLLDGKLEGKNLPEAVQDISDRYERIAAEASHHSRSDIMADQLSALAHAYDPHSDYLRKQDFDELNTDMRLSMVGIGITIESDGRFMRISDVYPASPAGVDGRLKPKDRILAVAHGDEGFVKIEGMTFDSVMELLHARIGTRIQLKVAEPGNPLPRVVDLVARTIELTDEQAKAEVIERKIEESSPADPKAPIESVATSGAKVALGEKSRNIRLGWLRIPSFYGDPEHSKGRSVAKDVRQLLKRLNGERIEGLVLDLRGNPGGELDEAVKIGGLFLGKVPIVQEKDSDGIIYVSKAKSPAVYHGPMVVLIDHLTASAAELLAAALQDHGRAIIAGGAYSSFGKGTVQTVLELKELLANVPKSDSFGAIQLTIAKFYRVNGASTQLKGLSADIPLPSPEDLPGEGEKAMKNPLDYDEAPPVEGMTGIGEAIAKSTDLTAHLKELSAARVRNDVEFRYLLEDLSSAKRSANRVSLNEAIRRKELAAEKSRTASRKAERADLARVGGKREHVAHLTLNTAKSSRGEAAGRKARNGGSTPTGEGQPDAVRNETLNILQDLTVLSKHSAAR